MNSLYTTIQHVESSQSGQYNSLVNSLINNFIILLPKLGTTVSELLFRSIVLIAITGIHTLPGLHSFMNCELIFKM